MKLEVDETGPSLKAASAKVTRTQRSGTVGAGFASNSGGSSWGCGQQAQQPADDPWGAAAAGDAEPPF
jgi:single-strand DNA-binding protein